MAKKRQLRSKTLKCPLISVFLDFNIERIQVGPYVGGVIFQIPKLVLLLLRKDAMKYSTQAAMAQMLLNVRAASRKVYVSVTPVILRPCGCEYAVARVACLDFSGSGVDVCPRAVHSRLRRDCGKCTTLDMDGSCAAVRKAETEAPASGGRWG